MQKQLTAIIEREGSGYVSLCPELDIAIGTLQSIIRQSGIPRSEFES